MSTDIFLIGLNHVTASVEMRERFVLTPERLHESGLLPLNDALHELVLLSTCNRVELTCVGDFARARQHVLTCWAKCGNCRPEELEPYLYMHSGEDAIRHLFRVASSLDSLVLGEPQILGQLKDAYRAAAAQNSTRAILNRLMHKAFTVAKRVRTETAVAASAVSISYAAVELAKRIFGQLSSHKAMLIGAGEMAELAAAHLLQNGIESLYIANRTHERALALADQFKGRAVPFDSLGDYLADVDIIISSTGAPEPILSADQVRGALKQRKQRPMFFIDIAVPRDIDPAINNLDNVYLYDIDDLKEVIDENLSQRREEAVKAQLIVEDEVREFGEWLKSLDLQPTIIDLLRRGEDIARAELDRTLKRFPDVPPETRDALEAMLRSVVKKIHHEPITFLKRRFSEDGGPQYLSTARRLFNLDNEEFPGHPFRHPKCGRGEEEE